MMSRDNISVFISMRSVILINRCSNFTKVFCFTMNVLSLLKSNELIAVLFRFYFPISMFKNQNSSQTISYPPVSLHLDLPACICILCTVLYLLRRNIKTCGHKLVLFQTSVRVVTCNDGKSVFLVFFQKYQH